MTSPREAGTNPRARGTNPRAQQAQDGTPPAASSGGGAQDARQEVATQIPSDGAEEVRKFAEQEQQLRAKLALNELSNDEVWAREKVDPAQWGEEGARRRKARAVVVGDHVEVGPALTAEELEEKRRTEAVFMEQAAQAAAAAQHDDECPWRKGGECSCRAVFDEVAAAEGKGELERRLFRWSENAVLKDGLMVGGIVRDAVMVKLDNGRERRQQIADPISAQNPPITITVQDPPRWVCTSCALSLRGNGIDHRCDPATLMKVRAPRALSRQLSPDVKFGGAYRLFLFRDREGAYHLGEEVVLAGRVVEERPIAGPESYNTIEGALLDAADRLLTP